MMETLVVAGVVMHVLIAVTLAAWLNAKDGIQPDEDPTSAIAICLVWPVWAPVCGLAFCVGKFYQMLYRHFTKAGLPEARTIKR